MSNSKNKAERNEVTIITNDGRAVDVARTMKSEYPAQKRLISTEGSILNAISAAYKTASGLHSKDLGEITGNIYNMSKIAVALLIAQNDSSDDAFDRAAFEVARDAFVSGKLEHKANTLALATRREPDACYNLILRKLITMTERMDAHTNRLLVTGEAPVSPEAVLEAILANGGKTLLSLPTAYGKTSKIITPVLQHYLDAGKKVLVISHRRSINKNVANLPGIVSYDECDHPDVIKHAQGLKIVVNSLSASKFKAFIESVDLVVIDEASQVISHVLGGNVEHREAVWDALNFVVKNTANAILSDADINARCADLIGDGARIFKIAQDHSGIIVRTGEINHVRALAIEAATGRKADPENNTPEFAATSVLIACDTVKEATALAKTIEKKGGPKALVITADNAKWSEQAAFIADPNSTTHQVVIYSPVITSALSITSGHFKKRFGLFQGQVVPSDAIQMLRRDRKAKEFVVGIKNSDYLKSEIVDVKFSDVNKTRQMACEKLSALDVLLAKMDLADDVKNNIRAAAALDAKPSAFRALEYKHCSDEAWLKDQIQNTLPATLLAQGFTVEVLEFDEDLSKSGFCGIAKGRKAAKEEAVSKLLASSVASGEIAKTVSEAGSTNEGELIAVRRAKAEEVMGVDDLTEEDAKVWGSGEGEAKIRNFRKLFNDVEYTGSSNDDVLGLLRAASKAMTKNGGLATGSAIELFDKLNDVRHDVIGLDIKISNAKSDQAKQSDITKIFSQFGLKTKKRDGGRKGHYYIITQDSFEQMSRYL
jgi:hypothetical protein